MVYNVSFPKIGIHLKINPILINMGNVKIYWYGILIALGMLLAVLYTSKRTKFFKIDKDKYLNIVYISIICAVLSARIYYVIFYPGDYYKNNPSKILNIFEGGIAIYGGILGGIVSGIVCCKIKKVDIKTALDLSSLGLLIGQTIGRWGNFVNQEAFGTITNFYLGMMSEKTNYELVHPCFLYESFWCLIGFIILHFYSKINERKDLNIFLIYISWYSFGRFFIEQIRTDSLMFFDFKVSQLLSVVMFFISTIILVLRNFNLKNCSLNV